MKSFESSTAADLMASPVITVNTEMTLSEAARTLSEQNVSGALVTDHRDAAVGVVSLFDIVSHVAGLGRSPEAAGGFYRYSYPPFNEGGEGWDAEWEDVEPAPMKETTVGEIMSAEIIEVPPDLPAREVAKRLAERHIHRIFVSGKNGPVGVISTMDILKSVSGVAKVGLHA
jgi:CBS domain-containing protein